jgi:hypothetical protein
MNNAKIANELLVVAREVMGAGGWSKANFLRRMAQNYSLTFRNKAQEEIWNEEILGQMNDGLWENTPNVGWEFWTEVKTSVGGSTSLHPSEMPAGVKTGFGFSKLTGYVGDRMLEIIRKYEPEATMKTLNAYLTEISEALRKGEAKARGGTDALPKDLQRIEDLMEKYPGEDDAIAAAERMARSITDTEKAIRRGKAAEKLGYSAIAEIFYKRARELMQ